ncbi:MAG: SpaA isopeptide-forming pilin-related protein [Blautia faecis]
MPGETYIPIATHKDGKMKKEIEYILVETKAPEGYVRSEKEENVVFEYKDDKTKEIEITKELTMSGSQLAVM